MYDTNDLTYSHYSRTKMLTNSFLWMFFGLLLTSIVAIASYVSGFILVLFQAPFLYMAIILCPLILCLFFGRAMASSTSTAIKVMFTVYAITLGFSMATLGFSYSLGTIGVAFGISAFYFLCLALIGLTTKRDMSRIGTLCMIGLFVMILSQLVFAIFRVSYDIRFYSIIGLLLFTGITIWDIQRMNRILVYSNGSLMEQEKISIYFALELYLDFINIFLYILRLIGLSNRD